MASPIVLNQQERDVIARYQTRQEEIKFALSAVCQVLIARLGDPALAYELRVDALYPVSPVETTAQESVDLR